jgi:glucosamine-6-phosphate deaminase
MQTFIFPTKQEMAKAAAEKAATILNEAIQRNGQASFVAATGASQFEFLEALICEHQIEWSKTTMFHLDEYLGLRETHPASFRHYLDERLIKRVNPNLVYLIQGDTACPEAECQRLNEIIARYEIDIAFVGIGENGHLAFNDPPADFDIEDPYIIVQLDEACRRQQLGEGWFDSLEEVPRQAISMSIKQIMQSQAIVCVVPDRRKQQAVYQTLTGEISPMNPASILRVHKNAHLFLDAEAAQLLGSQDQGHSLS